MNGTQQPVASMAAPAEDGSTQRGSGGSGRSGSGRSRQNPQQQLSTIEKSVTHLLVATKQLLETLTMWSTARATEGEVSDVYVRLGYEFNIACRAFNAIGVDTSDLGPVPDMLRTILEETLSQEANQQSLEKYLPRIRDIIINLLHGLKKKQQRLRQRSNRDGAEANRQPRQASSASSVASNLTEQLEDVPSRHPSNRSFAQRQGSGDISAADLPPRTTSAAVNKGSPKRHAVSPQNSVSNGHPRQDVISNDSGSSISSTSMQNMPVIAPYPENETMPTSESYEQERAEIPPRKQPQKANDALTALQRGGDLERRASRRFSAYQIQKHLGAAMPGMPAIPPSQNSPIPNRGRDARESLNAVRSRGSAIHDRARSRNQKTGTEASPNRDMDRRISEESSSHQEDDLPAPGKSSTVQELPASPLVKTPEDKLADTFFPQAEESFSATVNGPMDEPFVPVATPTELERTSTVKLSRHSTRQGRQYTPPASQFIPEGSPQAGKELTLFLQYKSKIKKFVLPDGGDLTIPRLQLAFIEKFAWNTHNNGVDLPEIYIQDPVSGVRHELEDLNDIKDRSVLVLNVEVLDEVKRHFDDGIGGLRRIVEGIKTSMDDQQVTIQRVSDRQQDTAKELAVIAAAPAPVAAIPAGSATASKDMGQLKEVQSLRRDLAVVRQTYTSFVSDMQASMTTLRTKAATVKQAAVVSAIPEMDNNTGRAYVNNGKKSLSDDSESIVNRVDDLQDLVEDLRKDVVTRGVRPLPRQLEEVSRDISIATSDLKKLQEFLRKEKPVWTKIWEKELQVVCDDRDLLTMQEELAADLEDDLEKAAQTFALVEQATKQQNLASPTANGGAVPTGVRSTSRTLVPIPTADPAKAKDSVLGEVRALQPNHESRLEAIERAERLRQRELETRREGEFQKELGNFVEEGKLKKSGGVEEVERQRKSREDRTRKEIWERQQQRLREMAEKEAAAAAAAAAEKEKEAEGAESADPAPVLAVDKELPPVPTEEEEEPAAADEAGGDENPSNAASDEDEVFEEAKEDAAAAPPADEPAP
ncbi:unnamed protein product [Zymoseptoria tritici ST99CH_1E4]|uniref:Actin interacting protein 3 C-terminal domain-containing protein n=1 Tax=Zymoseptoria tritici ST99CH_1E4 TaxID=1276532 RepID=A0A2H1H599_ZYMTR|nr:unnamed protein product [Zymoseptoria tritici ST99CH_1E4]